MILDKSLFVKTSNRSYDSAILRSNPTYNINLILIVLFIRVVYTLFPKAPNIHNFPFSCDEGC